METSENSDKKIKISAFITLLENSHKDFSACEIKKCALTNAQKTMILVLAKSRTLQGRKLSQSVFDILCKCGVTDFSGAHLPNINLSDRNLSGFCFKQCVLTHANVTRTNACNTNFENAVMGNITADDFHFDIHTNFKNALLDIQDHTIIRFTLPNNTFCGPVKTIYQQCESAYQAAFAHDLEKKYATRIYYAFSLTKHRWQQKGNTTTSFAATTGFFAKQLAKPAMPHITKLCLVAQHMREKKNSRTHQALTNLHPSPMI